MQKGQKFLKRVQAITTAAYIVGLFCGVFFICFGIWKYFNLVELGSDFSDITPIQMFFGGLIVSVSCYINLPERFRRF